MFVVTRYRVPAQESEQFAVLAREALAALGERPGCLDGRVSRSIDEPGLWVLSTRWESVGTYRRALSNAEVKMRAVPLMYRCIDEPTAFEDLATWSPGTGLAEHESDLIVD
ncbi:antibiotic biosynthesis monooxygenase [Kineosporia sp. J2-2]|uniref:Antibiotic biosynthesis monooxygenase n=1 Tax=Kineosporia corallincola TaxID=2835133 RepID=A0ABS5TIJ0_9ACTN|nr:antibiotic biosynthesis monooxygenase family protein [Kineosporia corallincola]MBT0770845.1 antibiotic biosynthesis monooxygenase [Kineosporia corallincola]